MAGCARIGETSRTAHVGARASQTVVRRWSVALGDRELALEDLAAATNGARRIAADDVPGGVHGIHVAVVVRGGTDLVGKGTPDTSARLRVAGRGENIGVL